MTQEQAQALLDFPELIGKDAHVHRIGNGEYVVIVRLRVAGNYYLWGESDLSTLLRE